MRSENITLAHGSGGTKTRELVALFDSYFKNPILDLLDDSALLPADLMKQGRLAFTTDSFVIKPVFFPGGDIGKLAITGTVNDLCCLGAEPKFISAGFIIEEGFPIAELEKIVSSMAFQARECEILITGGDTKVVGKGQADSIYINTSGIGVVPDNVSVGAHLVKPKDKIILTGTLGDHSIAVAIAREELPLMTDITSDCQALNTLVKTALTAVGADLHAIRDVTRGGLAGILNEIAHSSNVNILIEEDKLPVKSAVSAACSLLGFDVLHLANEGKMVLFVSEDKAEHLLNIISKLKEGSDAQIIGSVLTDSEMAQLGIESTLATAPVIMRTIVGGLRVVESPIGELLPRIC